MYDDFDDDGDWGYNGNAEHDMWVDYTSSVYEDSDGSYGHLDGFYDDYDDDCDDCDDEDCCFEDPDCDPDLRYGYGSNADGSMSARQHERHINRLEGLTAAAIAAAAITEAKRAKSSAQDDNRKCQGSDAGKRLDVSKKEARHVRTEIKKNDNSHTRTEATKKEARHASTEVSKKEARHKRMEVSKKEDRQTRIVAVVCVIVVLAAILIAALY